MSRRAQQLRAIPAPLAREPWRRCEQCELQNRVGGRICFAPIQFLRMCMPRNDAGHVLVQEEDAAFAERAVSALMA
jgi:hypothetical protein